MTAQYEVQVDDNFHYMNVEERYTLGTYSSADKAIKACELIIDKFLESAHAAGMTTDQLYQHYVMFGEDPFIFSNGTRTQIDFSAWDYAKQRSREITGVGVFGTAGSE